jgi:hypothetical protein
MATHCSPCAPFWKLSVCDLYFSCFSCSMKCVRRQGGDQAPQYRTRLASPSARHGHRSCDDTYLRTCQRYMIYEVARSARRLMTADAWTCCWSSDSKPVVCVCQPHKGDLASKTTSAHDTVQHLMTFALGTLFTADSLLGVLLSHHSAAGMTPARHMHSKLQCLQSAASLMCGQMWRELCACRCRSWHHRSGQGRHRTRSDIRSARYALLRARPHTACMHQISRLHMP